MSTQPNTPSEADRRTANEIIMAPRNQDHAAQLIATHVAAAVLASHRCPIGLDATHGICSAGTCDVCREAHLAGAVAESTAKDAEIARLKAELKTSQTFFGLEPLRADLTACRVVVEKMREVLVATRLVIRQQVLFQGDEFCVAMDRIDAALALTADSAAKEGGT